MPYGAQTRDLTNQYRAYDRVLDTFRVLGGVNYQPGLCVALASMDQQTFSDETTVGLAPAAANQQLIMGVVAETWAGFNGSLGAPSFLAPANAALMRGTVGVDVVTQGFHPAAFVDGSGTGAAAIVNGTPLIASRATPGYLQGGSAVGGLGTAAIAMLPATGIGSSITAAALAQATATDTLTGAPAAGDTLSVTIQAPYISGSPGVAQTLTFTTPPLTAGQAASVTTAAAALAAYLNAQPAFAQYFTATSALGVVTITVNGSSSPFLVTFGSGSVANSFSIGISGMVANSLSFAVSSTGGTISTASGATLAGGTGYKGTLPVYVV